MNTIFKIKIHIRVSESESDATTKDGYEAIANERRKPSKSQLNDPFIKTTPYLASVSIKTHIFLYVHIPLIPD